MVDIVTIIDRDCNIDEQAIRKRREIIIESHGGGLQFLQSNNSLYDPMSYTLLFPYWTLGWTDDLIQINDKKLSEMKYYSYRLHFRDKLNHIDFDGILHSGLLSHQYIIDCWIKTEECRLKWLSFNQDKLRAELYQGIPKKNSTFFLEMHLTYFYVFYQLNFMYFSCF